jgi:hypothetical protein
LHDRHDGLDAFPNDQPFAEAWLGHGFSTQNFEREKNYGGRVRQKGARTEGGADRDHAAHRAAQKGETYCTTLETLISVASRAAELFDRSKTEQKRELLAFVFSNLRLRGKKLEFSLRSPFDLMVNRADHSSWPPAH